MTVPDVQGTWWTYYTDPAGRHVVLTISVVGGAAHVVTSAGERLLFSPAELGALVRNLEHAVANLAR